MKALIAFILAVAAFVHIQSDVDVYVERAQDPNNFNGTIDLQMVVEQSLERMDALDVYPCFREWWALERSALFLLGESLRHHVMGNAEGKAVTSDAMAVLRFYGAAQGHTCTGAL